jgi:hypothetical protein
MEGLTPGCRLYGWFVPVVYLLYTLNGSSYFFLPLKKERHRALKTLSLEKGGEVPCIPTHVTLENHAENLLF